jgi:hypothetical protein
MFKFVIPLIVSTMTSKQIEEQIAAIRALTAKGLESKESAIRILTEAGIIKSSPTKKKRKPSPIIK